MKIVVRGNGISLWLSASDSFFSTCFVSSSSTELLFLDQNSLTGNITDVCGDFPRLKGAAADCGGVNPAVVCPCCQVCCDPNNSTACNEGDSLAQYDPEWNTGYNRQGIYLLRDMNITDDP